MSEVWVHQYAPTGMAPDEWGIGFEMTVTTSAWRGTNNNPNTGVWGLGSLISGSMFFNSLSSSFSLERAIQNVRAYYQNRFEANAGNGEDTAAFIDYVGLELVIPQDSADAGVQLGMAFIPEIKLGTVADELIHASLKRSKSYRGELASKTYKEILDLAKKKGIEGKLAKGMKKLIQDSERLMEKVGWNFR